MIACVPAEETRTRRFSDKKTEKVEVKVFACLQVRGIETEVAQPPNLKRAVQGNAAHVVLGCNRCRHGATSFPLQDADTTA
jgi:hypothetical protein